MPRRWYGCIGQKIRLVGKYLGAVSNRDVGPGLVIQQPEQLHHIGKRLVCECLRFRLDDILKRRLIGTLTETSGYRKEEKHEGEE